MNNNKLQAIVEAVDQYTTDFQQPAGILEISSRCSFAHGELDWYVEYCLRQMFLDDAGTGYVLGVRGHEYLVTLLEGGAA